MNTELKTCPFCGSDAAIELDDGKCMSGHYNAFVRCTSCESIETHYSFGDTKEEAVKDASMAWNTRSDDWQPIENAPKDGTKVVCKLNPCPKIGESDIWYAVLRYMGDDYSSWSMRGLCGLQPIEWKHL